MPYTLGITIDGTRITDKAAKILGLYIMGLCNAKISACLYMKPGCIHNEISDLYGVLGCEKSIPTIILLGKLNRFNHYCFVDGIDILDADERKRLHELKPRLLRENKRLDIVFTAV